MFNLFKKKTLKTIRKWSNFIHEPFSGAWQRNIHICEDDYPCFFAVFACITLIASDIAKLPIDLKKLTKDGIWIKTGKTNLFKRPNSIQTRYQFFENWNLSLLLYGNTYVFIIRDSSGKPAQLRILDPERVEPIVTDDGDVYYRMYSDNIAGNNETIIVRSTDILHDRINCMYHPLCGVSPLFSGGLAAKHGLSIQQNSTNFFVNGSRPGGILTVPGDISDEEIQELKKDWNSNYGGNNAGKTAVISGGVEFKIYSPTASDAQMIEQLGMSARVICSVFHVPPYKIGLETAPSNSAELDSQYYSQCLQPRLEAMEMLMDLAFDLPENSSFVFDLDSLLRMDAKARYETWSIGISRGWLKINEARAKENLPPVDGGDTTYLQQQNYSLAALSKRDSKEDPFSKQQNISSQTENQAKPSISNEEEKETESKMLALFLEKELLG